MVAALCSDLRVPHSILTARWDTPPETAIQERARRERYRLLGYWAEERRLAGVVTAHHADDQAETFLMRLLRGSGVRGLAGMRPRSIAPGAHVRLLRPLLGWRRAELRAICAAAGVVPAHDPSNDDERFERVRVRRILAENDWLDGGAIASSAIHLAEADEALRWAVELVWRQSVEERRDRFVYHPGEVPREITRRIAGRIIRKLATEGDDEIRGGELDRLLATLSEGGTGTLRGVLCEGGRSWRFERAPLRR